MTAISKTVLGEAILSVGRMDMRAKELLADDIHARQPQLFYSVLVQRRYGASLEQLEVLINALLTCYVAMKGAGREWPTVTEDVQERCLKRVTGRVRFIEGLTPEQQDEAVTTALADHREPWLLAFVFAEMRPILGIKTDAEKMLVLAALNLVECIAEAAPTSARGLRADCQSMKPTLALLLNLLDQLDEQDSRRYVVPRRVQLPLRGITQAIRQPTAGEVAEPALVSDNTPLVVHIEH